MAYIKKEHERFSSNGTKQYKTLPAVLNVKEQAALLSIPNQVAPTGYRNYLIIKMFLGLGLRVGELTKIRVGDIDWISGQVRVYQTKTSAYKVLYLDDILLAELQRLRGNLPSSSLLFRTLAGGPLHDRYIRAMVCRYADRAGIGKRVYPHLLRHTFGTDLYRQTKNIRLVQKALGHATLQSTMLYTHLADTDLEGALKALRLQ